MSAQRSVLLVGAGGMGAAWLDTVARRTDLRVGAIVDVVEDNALAAASARGLDAAVFTSVDRALAHEAFDLMINVTVPEAHLEVSSAALRAGVPVLTEKPVTPTVPEALCLSELSRQTGVLVATSQSRRYSPGITAFRDALLERGGAQQLSAQFFQNPRFGGFRNQMAHPLLLDMAIHTFDQARFIVGENPVSVYCDEFNPSWSWYASGAAAEAVFLFASGARFAYSGSWCADGLTTSWNGSWRGNAEQGTVIWDGETNVTAQGLRDDQPRAVSLGISPDGDGLDAALAEFIRSLNGGPAPSGEISQNIWSLAMVEAAARSANLRKIVQLSDVFVRTAAC